MLESKRIGFYALSILFLLAIVAVGHFIDRTDSLWLITAFVAGFVCYLLIWKSDEVKTLYWVGLLARVSLFFSLPSLSDDIFRFLWDGFLLKNGINPFSELPTYYLDKNVSGLTPELFELLNSKSFFTIYPPINQGIFWLAVTFSENPLIATGVIRLFLLAAEIGAFILLKRILVARSENQNLAYWYWLNPLIIIEGVGNIHFEILVIFFLTLALHFYSQNKYLKTGVGLGLAIGTKLLPLIFLPYFLIKDLSGRRLTFTLTAILTASSSLALLYSPAFVSGMQESIGLYFQNFEFNGSIYLIARRIGFAITGYNEIGIIGPVLSIVSFLSILTTSFIAYRKKWPVAKTMLFVLTVYLLFATTIHPWYILPLILLGILSGYAYPIIWSALIFITYLGYNENEYSLHWVWIFIEYFVVFLAFIFNNQLKKWLITS